MIIEKPEPLFGANTPRVNQLPSAAKAALVSHLAFCQDEVLRVGREVKEFQAAWDAKKMQGRQAINKAIGILVLLGRTLEAAKKETEEWLLLLE